LVLICKIKQEAQIKKQRCVTKFSYNSLFLDACDKSFSTKPWMRKGGNRVTLHIWRDSPTLAGGTMGTDDNQGHQQYESRMGYQC